MIRLFKKPYRWAALLSAILTITFVYVLLDSFVIPKVSQVVPQSASADTSSTEQDNSASNTDTAATIESDSSTSYASTENTSSVDPVITDTSYEDENIKISIETKRVSNTTVYIADIQISDPTYLKTALANNSFGRNLKETTSAMAQEHNAIFAINGDYYGFRDTGYVLRNGLLYRDTGNGQALVIDGDGNLSVVDESVTDAQTLLDDGAWQILSFGPALLENSQIVVSSSSEVSQSMLSNPRTAIGQISKLHYVIIVSDGRTTESTGLSLLELAEQFDELGCVIAYNLDGGGSSTMVFNGQVINNPTDGRSIKERTVSDIVYIGYE